MEAKPLDIVPSSHNNTSGVGGGPQKKIEVGQLNLKEGKIKSVNTNNIVVKQEKLDKYSSSCSSSSTSTCVQLHLGVAAASHPVITHAQRCELHHQVFIFNHLASNPLHPLHFPTIMLEHSHLGFDYGSMVDPEPHRCRRTDGKKWRCGKNVVPDQKYCERHMHRGRNNRSRKPVEETSQVNSPKPFVKSDTKLATKAELAVSNPNLLVVQPSDSSSNTPSRSLYNVSASYANHRLKNIIGSDEYRVAFSPAYAVSPGYTFASYSNMACVTSDNRSCLNMCKKDNQAKSCISNNISLKSGGKGSTVCGSNGISTGIGFSPRSVLQGSAGCNPSYINHRNIIESEPGRCRRTDGKKWRCKSAALPGQKYCATHMHRGAKKRFTNHEPVTTTAVTDARVPNSSATTNILKVNYTIPNTKHSMSVSPFVQRDEEKSFSSCDSDTTISDTINIINECSYASF